MRLTSKRVTRLLRQPGRYRDENGEVKGLLLVVVNRNNASWQLRYERDGREHWLGLGPARLITLKQARDRARAARLQLLDGVDPLEAKKAKKAAAALEAIKPLTFAECATGYIDANAPGWKNAKHENQWRMTLLGITPSGKAAKHDYCKLIRDLPVAAIDDSHVIKVLQPIWNTKTETADRIRNRIEKVLDRAKVLKLRNGENPARWVGHLAQVLPRKSQVAVVTNHPALPYEQMYPFMTELRQRSGVAARALEFCILTAARTNEIIGAQWSEIDKTKRLWTVPKERMKGTRGSRRRDHVVPLSRQALAILDDLPREGDYIFVGSQKGEPLSNAAMAAVIDRVNAGRVKAGQAAWIDPKQEDRAVVPHGFRSSFKDWAVEETSYDNNMSEMALSHTLPDKVEAAYRRGAMVEKRRALMSDWAAYCAAPRRDKVVAMRSAVR